MNEEDSSIESKSNDELKVGQLYTWDGHALVPVPPSEQAKIPVTLEALDAVRKVRAQATREGFRPCLLVTASQMLLSAMAEVEDLPDQVIDYGFDVYEKLRRKKRQS